MRSFSSLPLILGALKGSVQRQLHFPSALTQHFGCQGAAIASSNYYQQLGGRNGENQQECKGRVNGRSEAAV